MNTPIETTVAPTDIKPVPSGLLGKLLELWVFAKDHLVLAIFCVVALFAFFFLPNFKEFAYALLRAFIAVFFVAVIVYLWFKDTIRPYLVSGNFIEDFKVIEPKYRVGVTMVVLVAVLWAIVTCMVNP